MLVAGVAGLAGAMSMAAGEFVSVSSQSDTERADSAREQAELAAQPEFERRKVAAIYVARVLTPELAEQVAQQLMPHDADGSQPSMHRTGSPKGSGYALSIASTNAASG
jgi:vacuolar iron transporter family protein